RGASAAERVLLRESVRAHRVAAERGAAAVAARRSRREARAGAAWSCPVGDGGGLHGSGAALAPDDEPGCRPPASTRPRPDRLVLRLLAAHLAAGARMGRVGGRSH